MKSLETPKRIFTMFYIYPAAKSTSKWTKMTYTMFAVIILTSNFSAMISHLVYLSKLSLNDVKDSIFAFMGVSAYACVTYITATVFILRKQITAILDQLSAIYDAREYKFPISSVLIFETTSFMSNFLFKFR